jgi:alanine racemase
MNKHSRVCANIDLSAIMHNMEAMHQNIDPNTKIMAVIKADGYGHGAVPIAKEIEHLDYVYGYAAATVEEGMILRNNGIQKPILILGYIFPDQYEEVIQAEICPSVFTLEMAEELSAAAEKVGKDCRMHFAVDTGMSRIGFADKPESVEEIKKIAALPNVEIEGMFTHFARADETDKAPAVEQLERYLTFADLLEKAGVQIPLKHCSNSAGIIRMPEANLNLVRAGITIYGIYPSDEVERDIVKLKPAMELKSHVAYVKDLPAGTAISYGGTFASENDLRVATIPVGYADGYPRTLSNKGWVLIHGQKAPILGRVCMDQFMVDVTHIPDVKHGDEVTLIGRDGDEFISIETFGDMSGRFSYEFACDISKRVPRVYIKDGREWGDLTFFE